MSDSSQPPTTLSNIWLYNLIFLGQPLLPLTALSALIWLGGAHYTHQPTTLNAYDDTLLLVNGVYKPMQIAPRRGLSFDLAVLAHENGIAAALPAAVIHD
ncbi:hypothetical protein B0H14DRAFT_3474062 [Mycena olivaceomarginata]|nr:hypothetical protein B0H14DRAFT_3474062 [Mycena olivaceomarginata]